MARQYLDFDLLVEDNEDGSHTARAVASPAGEASHRFRLPFSPLELENFILRMGHTRARVRGADTAALDAARQFGSTLYDAVFSGDLGAAYLASVRAAEQENKGLRLRLRLGDAPQLTDLPWELLYSSSFHDFVALSEKRPVVRYVDLPNPVRPLAVTPPLRIVVVVSSPSDVVELDIDRERSRLTAALAGLVDRGLVELRFLENATLSALQLELERSDINVLHFIGHGGYDPATGDGTLMFEDEQGRGRRVPGSTMATLLNDHDPLRLLVLNACEGARSGMEDPFAGVALSVVRRGTPAVIAMQFEITDTAALTFANHFYLAVANGLPIDAACTAARKAVFAQDNQVEWATPVLYLRAPDGVVFQVDTAADSVPTASVAPPAMQPPPPEPASEQGTVPGRRKQWVAVGVAVAVIAGAGLVGGVLLDDGEDPVTTLPPTTVAAVTREQWAAEADAVCAGVANDSAQPGVEMVTPVTPEQQASAASEFLDIGLGGVFEMDLITPPPADEEAVHDLVDAWNSTILSYREAITTDTAGGSPVAAWAEAATHAGDAGDSAEGLDVPSCVLLMRFYETFATNSADPNG